MAQTTHFRHGFCYSVPQPSCVKGDAKTGTKKRYNPVKKLRFNKILIERNRKRDNGIQTMYMPYGTPTEKQKETKPQQTNPDLPEIIENKIIKEKTVICEVVHANIERIDAYPYHEVTVLLLFPHGKSRIFTIPNDDKDKNFININWLDETAEKSYAEVTITLLYTNGGYDFSNGKWNEKLGKMEFPKKFYEKNKYETTYKLSKVFLKRNSF